MFKILLFGGWFICQEVRFPRREKIRLLCKIINGKNHGEKDPKRILFIKINFIISKWMLYWSTRVMFFTSSHHQLNVLFLAVKFSYVSKPFIPLTLLLLIIFFKIVKFRLIFWILFCICLFVTNSDVEMSSLDKI